MQPFSAIHDPYAGATPSMRLEAAARRMRLERIASKAKIEPLIIELKAHDEPEAIPPIVPAQSWTDRQKEIHKAPWFHIENEVEPLNTIHTRIEDILRAVCQFYSVSRINLVSDRRTAPVVRIRQIGMFLAKEFTQRSLPEIGRHFGGRDHTTVLHACRKIERLYRVDRELADELNFLRETIRSAN